MEPPPGRGAWGSQGFLRSLVCVAVAAVALGSPEREVDRVVQPRA